MHLQIPAEERKLCQPAEHDQPSADYRGNPCAARDVPAGTLWAFTHHRTLAEIIAEGLL